MLDRLLADVVLVLHVGVVAFVVGGLALCLLGNARGWAWVNRAGFRVAHAIAIAVVVAESWLGLACPLTWIEQALRARAGALPGDGAGSASETFVGHWLSRLLYYDAPGWVFTLVYSLFGLAVLATWLRFPPRRAERHGPGVRRDARRG
jgi:hypothetical protein